MTVSTQLACASFGALKRASRHLRRPPGLRLAVVSLSLAMLLLPGCDAGPESEGAAQESAEATGVIEQAATAAVKLMVVGDSISQGHEGDYTWRYRLSEHLKSKGVSASFVGPWTGTDKTGAPVTGASQPSHAGAYRPGITFSQPRNLAEWGWMMGEAKWVIADHMKTYAPDVLLVELGFNDIAWNLSGSPAATIAQGVLDSFKQLVTNARAVNPKIKVLIADVPQRTAIATYPALPGKITAYNSRLDGVIAGLHTSTSPVYHVYFDLLYNENTDTYDGLHPNTRGEYVIAQAFASELANQLGIGAALSLPSSFPADLTPGATRWLEDTANPDFTATMRWEHVFGALGYWVWTRDLTKKEVEFSKLPFPVGADGWHPTALPAGHVIEYKLQTSHGDYASAFSAVSTLRTPTLAPVTMRSAVAGPGAYTVTLTWNPVANADDYHIYAGGNCDSPTDPSTLPLVQWSLGPNTTSWTQTYVIPLCMNYYVVASRNGGESAMPSAAVRVWPVNTMMFGSLEDWLIGEIDRNMHGDAANEMRAQISLGITNPALLAFGYLVRRGGAWDHKPMLETYLTDGHPDPLYTRVLGREDRSVFYDIWSNIHYGFIGRSIGFGENLLQTIPNANLPIVGNGPDPSDTASIAIGMSLWTQFGLTTPTRDALHSAILANINVLRTKAWTAGMH